MEIGQLSLAAIPVIEDIPVIRVILAGILMFFLPGFGWSLVLFTKNINIIERLAISVGLSIALVTLAILALNIVFHVRINGFNGLIIIILITVIPFGIYFVRRYMARRAGASGGE